jgi:hypothetical protein
MNNLKRFTVCKLADRRAAARIARWATGRARSTSTLQGATLTTPRQEQLHPVSHRHLACYVQGGT